jgi:hypothetical protein
MGVCLPCTRSRLFVRSLSELQAGPSYTGMRRKQVRKSDAMRGNEVRALKVLFQSLWVSRFTNVGAATAPWRLESI